MKSALRTWQGFWRLSGPSRPVALEGAAALAVTCLTLRLAGFHRCKSWLSRFTRKVPAPADSPQIATALKIARIQEGVLRHLTFHASCLEQSLALCWLLGTRGIPVELRIGVRKETGRFEAHAWVEVGNVVLNDNGEAHMHFAPFDGSIISMETQIR